MPVTYGGPSGKRLKDDDPRVARHRQILVSHGLGDPYGGSSSPAPSAPMVSSPVSGAAPQAQQKTGGGGKGGGRPDIDPSKVADSKYNKDDRYGYYRPDGTYVSAFMDMRDGGGKNQSGNYFVGGGLISSLLNAAKIRPAGAARERDPETGEYIVPREDIGYRDFKDMRDRGGPQASGGKFQGGGGYSAIANLLYGLSGQEFGERVPYGSSVPAAPTPTNGGVGGGSSTVTPTGAPTSLLDTKQMIPRSVSQAAASEDAYIGQMPYVYPDMSGITSAPAIRSGLVGYNPQVTSGVVSYTPTPTQGVTDEVYLPAGTQTGSNLTSAQLEQAQRARDYMGFRNAGGQSSYEEWLQGIYR